MNRLSRSLASLIERRAWLVIGGACALTAVFAFGISHLQFKTTQDTLLSPDSKVAKDNRTYQDSFGGEPIIILLEGDVMKLFEEPDRSAVDAMVREFAADPRIHSVVTPASSVELGVSQVDQQAAAALFELGRVQDEAEKQARAKALAVGAAADAVEAAAQAGRRDALARYLGDRAADLDRFQAAGEVSVANPKFAEFVLFDADGRPRPGIEGIVPDHGHALIVVRLAGNMAFDEQSKAAAYVRDRSRDLKLEGLSVLPAGPALLLKEINDGMRTNMVIMGAVSAAVMASVLFLVFRARWRLLALPVVLAASVWTFGFLGYISFPLTLVTISALPILIGLGVDFAVQIHNRFEEEQALGVTSPLGSTLARTGKALGLAVVGAVAGFLALQLSAVPMVRDFSLMLALGAIVLLAGAVFGLGSALTLRERPPPAARPVGDVAPVERVMDTLARGTIGRAVPIVAIGGIVFLAGVWSDQRLGLETDPERFVSRSSPVLRDLRHIRDVTRSSDEIDFLVEASDVRDPGVETWMLDFQDRQIQRHPELLIGASPASVVRDVLGRPPLTEDEAASVLGAAPDQLRRTLISADGTKANLVFNVGRVSLAQRKTLVDSMAKDLNAPPGVRVSPGGLAVIGVATVDALGDKRTLMTVVALGAIFVVLAGAFRSVPLAVVALLPVLFAVGTSATLLYVLGIDLNPLTAVSGPLVIAMGTEFTVLLMSRYREEREAGREPREALAVTMSRIGRAILASGLTVVGGFGALMFADFPLLQDFGRVTALNVFLSLTSALIVLPPVLIWLDEEAGLMPVPHQLEAR